MPLLTRRRDRRRSRGQSLVEFALLLPVFLLLLMVSIDFGRVYLGWVHLQNMARIGSNFAANNPDAWGTPGDAAVRDRYAALIENDARAINCQPQDPLPAPAFPAGVDLGDPVDVRLDCRFAIFTPIIGDILGGEVLLSANAVFPVKSGIVGTVPGGGGAVTLAPLASFTASPESGFDDLEVLFTDTSANEPTSWTWQFGDGVSSFEQYPTHIYTEPGTYIARLRAANTGGFADAMRTIVVTAPPTTGPIPDFTGDPRSGVDTVSVQFTDTSMGGATTWSWAFGDGATSTQQNPTHIYNGAGSYDVTLEVSDGTTANSQTKNAYIVVTDRVCVVPNFAGTKKNNAQSKWEGEFFTTDVTFAPGKGNYTIGVQTLQGGLENPPGGCGATIQVGP